MSPIRREKASRVAPATPRRSRAYGAPSENLLIKGDNLTALKDLAADFKGVFRCAYLDPPFNSGRTFAEYNDRRGPEEWLAMMRPRLVGLRDLLREDGALFVEIDDTELGGLLGLLDSIFGRENRVSIITVVRSASTGHKARNRGPVNVTDFLLLYAKDRARFRPHPLFVPRKGFDRAYSLFVPDVTAPHAAWTFLPLSLAAARSLGHASMRDAVRATGREDFVRAKERFALDHAGSVVRFAEPRYEAVGRVAQGWIDRSKGAPDRVFFHPREGRAPMILKGGNRVLFLSDKTRESNGVKFLAEPLTNVWSDVPFQGIAREGGVRFSRNKKPERLLMRVLEMASVPGDWVLDPFLGSGTFAAVAHKMGRRWVGIEAGDHFEALCVPRLSRVVDGEDRTGVTEATGWAGGGGFRVRA